MHFYIGTPEFQWKEEGDGVEFEIIVNCELRNANSQEEKIFSKYIDPKNNKEDRKWHECKVDISKYFGKTVDIIFITEPGPKNDNGWDWAGWADIEIE